MQRIRTEILPGVWLTALRTEKFKTAWLSVNLLTQLRRETAACTAVLPYVLRRGCTRLPDLEAIAAELDGLYGAHITPVVHKLGEIQAVGFEADFADDGALGEEIFPRLAADVADLLLHPNTRGGLLRPDIVDSERTQLIARIRAAVNNKRSYARERLYTHMCCCEDFAVPRFGEEADAERIHYRKLTMRYHDLLSTSPVEIFYCGSIDGRRVARILTDVLSTMPRGALDEDIGTDIRMNALEEQPRYVTETLPVAQAQLAAGYRLGTCMEDPDLPVLFVLNALYGGCVTSKLFSNLRERLSLCYSGRLAAGHTQGAADRDERHRRKSLRARARPRSPHSSTPCAAVTLRTRSCAAPSAVRPVICAPEPTHPTRWRGTGSTARYRGWTLTRRKWLRSWRRSRATT